MRPLARLRFPLLLLVAASAAAAADPTLPAVQRAQALLGDAVWSRVVRIENTARTGPYPRDFHALVFEFERLLWFYTPCDGTQSFSMHRGRLEAEKADFAPLMRDIGPGFRRWQVVPPRADAPAARADDDRGLPNGCFVESVLAFRRLWAQGRPMARPRLVSYYGRSREGPVAHTVLAYDAGGDTVVVDPDRPGATDAYPSRRTPTVLELARAHQGPDVGAARELPIEAAAAAALRPPLVAALPLSRPR